MTDDAKPKPELEIIDTEADVSDDGLTDTIDASAILARDDITLGLPEVVRDCYSFGAELARGGMGRILYAEDRRMGRPVVVKELLYDEPVLAARFEREALLTARLQHPAIVPIYEAGRWPSGEPFYAMKKVDGRPLDKLIAEAGDLRERLALLSNVISVAEAIAYAHSRGIIHRDLKPANILVGAFGETVVIDWGLAKDLRGGAELYDEVAEIERDGGAGLTATGAILGTPAYMPPEQARGEPVDERADVYAIGALLYHALSGRPTFTGASSKEILSKVISGPPPPLADLEPRVPGDLLSIIEKAMAFVPGDRYPSGRELADELRRFSTGQLVGAHDYSTVSLVRRWVRRHRTAVAIGAASLVILAVAIGLALSRVKAEADHARARLADLLIEQGRRELTDRRPLRAMTYFAEALEQDPPVDRAFATMLGQALEPTRAIDAVLERHAAPVTALAVSPDGAALWTAARDHSLRLWSLPGGEHRRDVWLDSEIRAIALGPRGERMAVTTESRLELLDTARGEVVATLHGRLRDRHRPRVAFSPDGAQLVAVGLESWATVHDAKSGEVTGVLRGHDEQVLFADWSADGTAIITGSADASARVWDAASFEQRALLQHSDAFGPTPITAARLSADNRRAITAAGAIIAVVWDVAEARETYRFQAAGVRDLWWSPDQSQVITAGARVQVWRPGRERPVAQLAHPDRTAATVAFNADRSRLAVLGDRGTEMVWNTADWSLAGSLWWRSQAAAATAFAPDGQLAIAADWEVVLWRPRGGLLRQMFREGDRELSSAALRGDRVMTAGRGGIGVWSVDSGAQLARFDVAARGAVLDPAGRRVVYVLEGDPRYHLADVAGGEGRAVLERPAGDQATEPAALYQTFGELPVSFSPDGRLIAAIQLVGGAHVWDASTGRHLRALSASPFRGGEIRFVDGGGLLVTNGAELAMWDPASWTRRWAITLGEAAVGPIEPVPGARAVAAGNEHGDAWIVGLDGAIERSFEAIHRSSINEVSFAEVDGDLLMILASDDHTISITDLTSGALRHRLEGHTEMVAALDVDTSGQLIASGSIDASVRLWDVRTGKQIAELLGAPDLGPLSAWFTRDGRAVLTSLGDAAALWSVAPARPGAREIADLDLRWAIERGSLVRR